MLIRIYCNSRKSEYYGIFYDVLDTKFRDTKETETSIQ